MSSSLSVGDVVDGRYDIRAALGETPAYLAYRAFDREIEVEVALWWMRVELFPEPTGKSSFVGAVVDLRGTRHANLRRMFDAGHGPGYLYATAQLDNDDGSLLRPGTGRIASELELVQYATAVAGALEAAHAAGHVHGRLVPSDVAQVAGLLKVGGAGLYRDVDPRIAAECWRAHERYLSPEVRGGAIATPSSDVYSLGRLIAELSTGQTPGDTEELIDLVEQHRPELANVLEAALSVAPHRRPESPAALLEDVRYGLIDERIPTAEAAALPASDSDVILLTPKPQGGEAPRGKRSPGLGTRSSPNAKTLLEGQPVAPARGVSAAPAGKTIPDVAEVPSIRASFQDGFDDEETVEERVDEQLPPGIDTNDDPERTIEDPDPELPELSPAQRVRQGDAVRSARAQPPGVSSAHAPPATAGFDPDRTVEDRRPAGAGHAPEERAPAPRAPVRRSDPSIRFVSMKPKTEPNAVPKAPVVPAIDRPEMKPILRPLSSLSSSGSYPPGTLGRYAPPRPEAAASPKPETRPLWPWIVLGGVVAAVILFFIWFFALRTADDSTDSGRSRSSGAGKVEPAPTTTPLPAAPTPAEPKPSVRAEQGPCPAGMALVAAKPRYCIDRYESPGKGRMPETGVSFAQAAAECRTRGARLCSESEWEAACRGEGDSSYPYGSSYRRGVCNTDTSHSGAITVAGQLAECVSAAGAYDMSGNVAEWVADETLRGGSALDRSDGRCSRSRRVPKQHLEGFSDVGFRCCASVGAPAP